MLGILEISNRMAMWNASANEQFYHLRFVPTIYMQDSSPLAPPKKYHSQQVIWIEDGGEEL
ncbi:12184_t:CDS:2 [Dentiscutata heterogama]|uniref:12184_t:CDS:1 n=1 Tax=Dentiscutata heterogama TaxID=1316150 RepID=A0ACA9LZZ5_9GLOM|nr:12184_t:CDS:2 [Dentiscutata heterogama]